MSKDIYTEKITDDLKPTWNTKRGVKIVNHPLYGFVDVCPFPESHFDELRRDAQRVRDLDMQGAIPVSWKTEPTLTKGYKLADRLIIPLKDSNKD